MNDPHVVELRYTAKSERDDVTYDNPPPIEHETPLALYRLADGVLTIHPREHYATEDDARQALEQFLRAWEANTDLNNPVGCLRFEYKHNPHFIDREPPSQSEGGMTIYPHDVYVKTYMEPVLLTENRRQYPAPPGSFNADSELVRDIMARYRQWNTGGEPFQSMANAVLTRIETQAGGRSSAADSYSISKPVLSSLGKLLGSGRGTALEVRKFTSSKVEPLTAQESEWIRQAIPAIIRQVAAAEAGATPAQLTMDKLPAISL